MHQTVEGEATVGDAAHLGVAAYKDAALGVLGGVAAVDADAIVMGHADEQRQPTVKPWAQRHHHGVASFGDGGLALGLAASVVEINPMRFKGITEIGPRGEHAVLTAADAEATDGISRTLRDAWLQTSANVMKFMESKESDVIIIRQTTNCQNEDPVFSSTPTPSTGRPFPRKSMFHHTKENMQIFLTIKFNFVLLPIEYWLVSTIDRQEQNLHRH